MGKRHKPEEIIAKLRQVEVMTGQARWRLCDELLNGETFTTLREAQIVIEEWRRHYNRVRPHSWLGYKPSTPEVVAWPASPAVESAPPAIALRPRLN